MHALVKILRELEQTLKEPVATKSKDCDAPMVDLTTDGIMEIN